MQTKERSRLMPLLLIVLLMCILTLATTFSSAPKAHADGMSCQVTYTVLLEWTGSPGGASVMVKLKNTGTTPINGWTLSFAFPNGQVILYSFNGEPFTQTGANVTFTNASFNASIQPGFDLIYSPGFVANWSGVNHPPTSFTLNGVLCSNG